MDKIKEIVLEWLDVPLLYDEYGTGARILYPDGTILADFENHLDAERFLDLIEYINECP